MKVISDAAVMLIAAIAQGVNLTTAGCVVLGVALGAVWAYESELGK